MASTTRQPGDDEVKTTSDTSTGEPIAETSTSAQDTPLAREQREITNPDVDDDGIHRGVTGPPKGANGTPDDGNDPDRPNITPLGRDVKYPHQLTPPVEGHDVTTQDIEDDETKRSEGGDVKRVDVNEASKARTTSRSETPGTKR